MIHLITSVRSDNFWYNEIIVHNWQLRIYIDYFEVFRTSLLISYKGKQIKEKKIKERDSEEEWNRNDTVETKLENYKAKTKVQKEGKLICRYLYRQSTGILCVHISSSTSLKENRKRAKIKFLNGLETRGEVLLSRGDDDTSSAGTTRASRNELIVPSYLFYQPD